MAEITPEEYAALEALIGSDDSPVGIDAKKTHILILHRLADIQRRLERLEAAAEHDSDAPSS
jgi:hypothetical protein